MNVHAVGQLKEVANIKPVKPRRPAFFNPETLPWLPWVMEGTYFKLLNINPVNGGFTNLLKVDPDSEAPVHLHIAAIEAYMVDGEFGYDDDRGSKGWYVYEEAGSLHKPDTPTGMVIFAVNHGPLVGYNEDGTIAAVIDAKFMYDLAKAGGAADHLAHYYE